MMRCKMRVSVFGNRFKLFVLVLLLGLCNYADATCYKCDTLTDPNCGLELSVGPEACTDETLGCYNILYEVTLSTTSTDPQKPGFYTKRGCFDELTDTEKESCPGDLCEICTTSDCNNQVFPTNRGTCMKCQGSECSTSAEVSTMCQVHLENHNCVTLFDEEGVVQHKNCYADVFAQTRDICDDETQIDCTKCNEDNCNTDTQQRGLKCFRCNSLSCFTPDDPSDVVGCVSSSCYVGINANGENVRDCSSAIADISKCGNQENENVDCIVCREPLCNGLVFPSINRQVCQVCVGDECSGIAQPKTCEIASSSEKCVTVFDIIENNVIERGCSSSLVNQQVCEDNSERCRQCSNAGCNTDTDITKIFHCIACNTLTDSSCSQNPIISSTSCSTDSCYSKIVLEENSVSRYLMERGCSADNTGNCVEPNCISCAGENCNNKKFPSNRLTCLKCANEECQMDNIPEEMCVIHDPDHLYCVTIYSQENDAIYRDCYADSAVGTQTYCDDDNQLSCTKCTGDSCNKDSVRRGNLCFKCSGITCFNPELPSDSIECSSSCYVGINEQGEMVRDCASNIADSNKCSSINSGQTDCLLCSGDYCNGDIFPTNNRLQCKTCHEAAECGLALSVSSICPIYSASEKCVSVFDTTVDQVVERGCLSSLGSQSLQTCATAGPNCVQCSFNDCNVEVSKLKTFHCYNCDSTTDALCISSPNSLISCETNECYSSLVEGTALGMPMKRGCLADNPVCTSPSCLSCSGEYCNTGVFPIDRLKCFSCANDECLSATVPEKLCKLYNNVNQNCITFYSEDNSVIYRDCYTDAPSATRTICDDQSEIGCTKCSGPLCNRDAVRRGNICIKCSGLACYKPDIPADTVNCLSSCYVGVNDAGLNVRDCSSAISDTSLCGTTDNGLSKCLTCEGDFCNNIAFPLTGRLQCQTCLGSENCKPDDANIQYCQSFNVNETCVSIFDSVLNQVNERGCSSDVRSKPLCDANNVNCKKCSGNNCNLDTSKAYAGRCISCNSALDPLCVANPTKWIECATNECYSRVLNPTNNNAIGHHIERGCSADLLGDCTEPDCKKCQGLNCNNLKFPTDRMTCLKCTNEGCQADQTQSKQCVLYNRRYQGCITFFDELGKVNYRDCYADAPQITQSICNDEKQLGCTKCTGNLCNTEKTRRGNKCLKCNGLTCFNPDLPADLIDCLSPCYIGLNVRGESVRDCAASVLNSGSCGTLDNENNKCLVCSGDGCNAIDFPLTNRLSCYSCLGDECLKPTMDAFCARIDSNERCATVFDISADTPIERGCVSNLRNQRICDANDPRCVKCNSETCNTDMSRTSKVCAMCTSANDPNCVRNPLVVPQKSCTKGCYTKLTGEVLTRGCEEDLLVVCNATTSCQLCNSSDRCNVQQLPANRLSCLTSVWSTTSTPQLCINHRTNDRCVTIFSGYNVAGRGCLSDQTAVDAQKCSGNTSYCTQCSSANCNTATVRSDEKCITCDSTSDARCSQKPLELPTQMCSVSGNGVCFAWVIESGSTMRGCAGTLTANKLKNCQDGIGGVCSLCTGSSCNTDILPKNHLKCYTCSSVTNADCKKYQAENSNLLPCRNHISGDECVFIKQNNNYVRGCLSDFPMVCADDSQGCKRCTGEGCNSENHSTIVKLHLACLLISLSVIFKCLWKN